MKSDFFNLLFILPILSFFVFKIIMVYACIIYVESKNIYDQNLDFDFYIKFFHFDILVFKIMMVLVPT
jgi:hypothetical protein